MLAEIRRKGRLSLPSLGDGRRNGGQERSSAREAALKGIGGPAARRFLLAKFTDDGHVDTAGGRALDRQACRRATTGVEIASRGPGPRSCEIENNLATWTDWHPVPMLHREPIGFPYWRERWLGDQ